MEDIDLVRPVAASALAVEDYRKEFMDSSEAIHGSGNLESFASYAQWLETCVANEHEETVPEGRVPATQYLAVRGSDGKLVGMIQIRHALNDYLRQGSGHIGYSVRASERRKGYATQMLRLALMECRKLGFREVLVSCNPENIASAGVIKANGGVFEKQATVPGGEILDLYWVTLP